MSPVNLFRIHLVFGYVAWLLCFSVYLRPGHRHEALNNARIRASGN